MSLFTNIIILILVACGTIKIIAGLDLDNDFDLIIGLLFLTFAKLMELEKKLNNK